MYINIRDSAQLASKLTFKRIKNALQIYTSFHSAKKSGKSLIKGLPLSLSVEPTTACNLRCPECPSGLRSFTRPTGRLQQDLYEKVINELSETLLYLIFYFQGEPYLHPQLLSMIRYAADKNIYTATSTNAHFLTENTARQTIESGLDRLIISIDGTTQEVYEAYRKSGKLDKVLSGTRNIVKWKRALKSKTPHVVWQFLVVRPNQHQIGEVKKLSKTYGVDRVAFKTAQIYDYKHGNDLIPTIDRYSRYLKQADGTYVSRQKFANECWKMWHSTVMTWDGRVVPCCFDKDAQHVLGNASEKTFRDIWHSESYYKFRQTLMTSRSELDMCKNCSEGAKVWA